MDDQEYTGLYSYRLISCVDAITNHAQNIYQSTIADEKHLEAQMHHRTVSFAPDSFSDQVLLLFLSSISSSASYFHLDKTKEKLAFENIQNSSCR